MSGRKPLHRSLRDFVYYRARAAADAARNRGPGWIKHRVWRRLVPYRPEPGTIRLHVGSGTERLDGWVNIDLQPLTEVDVCADVTDSFPYRGVQRIFAEHFLEHLSLDDAIEFLVRCHEALAAEGRLRLSTPNLDWVWATQYGAAAGEADRPAQALALNRCFYAWGHRFLWNRELLTEVLEAAGFVDLAWCRYGKSDDPEFQGLERHETWQDAEELPHVLIVEATRGDAQPERLRELRERAHEQFGSMLPPTHR